MRRLTGGLPSGAANEPAMYWSPKDRTGDKALLPQMRQVLRVTRIGENNGADMQEKLAKKGLRSKEEQPPSV